MSTTTGWNRFFHSFFSTERTKLHKTIRARIPTRLSTHISTTTYTHAQFTNINAIKYVTKTFPWVVGQRNMTMSNSSFSFYRLPFRLLFINLNRRFFFLSCSYCFVLLAFLLNSGVLWTSMMHINGHNYLIYWIFLLIYWTQTASLFVCYRHIGGGGSGGGGGGNKSNDQHVVWMHEYEYQCAENKYVPLSMGYGYGVWFAVCVWYMIMCTTHPMSAMLCLSVSVCLRACECMCVCNYMHDASGCCNV